MLFFGKPKLKKLTDIDKFLAKNDINGLVKAKKQCRINWLNSSASKAIEEIRDPHAVNGLIEGLIEADQYDVQPILIALDDYSAAKFPLNTVESFH